MNIKVRFYGIAYEHTEIREWYPALREGSSVEDLLDLMVGEYPELQEMVFEKNVFRDYLAISINNVDILGLDGAHTVLKDGDIVFVMPPIGGG